MPPKKKELRTKMLADGSLKISIPCFTQTRGERLSELKNTPFDIKLQVGPEKQPIEAHRTVLSAEVPYFSAMFSGNFQESTQKEIDLPDIETDSPIKTLMALFYKGTCTVTTQDVQDVFVVCDIWGLDSIKQHCVDFMVQELDCYNCFDLLSLGEMYNIQLIVDTSRDFISREFQIIAKLDSFVELPTEALMALVQRSDLNMGQPGEDGILQAVTRWLRHNWPLREQHVEGLLPHFRFSRTSNEARDDLISLSPDSIRPVVERQMLPFIHKEPHWIWLPSDFEPKRKRREKIMAFCGHSHTRTGPLSPKIKSVELFNVDTLETQTVELEEAPSFGAAFNLLGRPIYFAVFVHTDPATKKTVIDSQTYTFRPEQPVASNMYRITPSVFSKDARDCLTRCLTSNGSVAHCPVKNRIYAVTVQHVDCIKVTCSQGEILCEYEKPLLNLKEIFQDNQVGMGCVCCRGKLYVIGGRWGPELEHYVSREIHELNEESNKWELHDIMRKSRSDFAVAACGRRIVVSGGYGGREHPRRLLDCEEFDPGDGSWYPFPKMRQHKTHHCIVVANGKLYALGGKSYSSHKLANILEGGEWMPGGARIVSNVIEKQDTQRLSWERFGKLSKGRCRFCAIAV